MVDHVVRYLLELLSGWGAWILLLATSMGRLDNDANDPARRPSKNLVGIDGSYTQK